MTMLPGGSIAKNQTDDGNKSSPSTNSSVKEAKPTAQGDKPSGTGKRIKRPDEVTSADAIKAENTEDSTTFDLGESNKLTVFYADSVRYRDKNGKLKDYDPSLIPIKKGDTSILGQDLKGYGYTNIQGDKRHYIPRTLSTETPILTECADYAISISPLSLPVSYEEEEPILESDTVALDEDERQNAYQEDELATTKAIYAFNDEDTQFEYVSCEKGIKENIILEKRPESNTIKYELKLTGLIPVKNELGYISFYDKAAYESRETTDEEIEPVKAASQSCP